MSIRTQSDYITQLQSGVFFGIPSLPSAAEMLENHFAAIERDRQVAVVSWRTKEEQRARLIESDRIMHRAVAEMRKKPRAYIPSSTLLQSLNKTEKTPIEKRSLSQALRKARIRCLACHDGKKSPSWKALPEHTK
jgi:hypothetical protein